MAAAVVDLNLSTLPLVVFAGATPGQFRDCAAVAASFGDGIPYNGTHHRRTHECLAGLARGLGDSSIFPLPYRRVVTVCLRALLAGA